MSLRYSTDQIIEKFKNIHGNKYDYSKVEYIGWDKKVIIICPEHGEFKQTPNQHIKGKGCPKCIRQSHISSKDFIEKSISIHGNKYDYSKVEYINVKTPVIIICPEHGEFKQTPQIHLRSQGCPKCGIIKQKQSTTKDINTLLNEFNNIHGNKYDYSKVEYINNKTPVIIICPEHGEFKQLPKTHLRGQGCPKCGKIKSDMCKWDTKDSFIKKSINIHGNKYDYSKVEYISSKTKVCVICPEHGEFLIAPSNHLQGQGCPKCKESHLEKFVSLLLIKYNIHFERQKTFNWLKNKRNLYLDFYLPEYNIAIECQGEQHFRVSGFIKNNKIKSEKLYEDIKIRDKIKYNLCTKNNIKIFYINYNDNLEEKINELKNYIYDI